MQLPPFRKRRMKVQKKCCHFTAVQGPDFSAHLYFEMYIQCQLSNSPLQNVLIFFFIHHCLEMYIFTYHRTEPLYVLEEFQRYVFQNRYQILMKFMSVDISIHTGIIIMR